MKILTLYYKPWSIVKPDYYSREISNWIVFPWEIKETLRKLVAKYKGKKEPFEMAASRLIRDGVSERLVGRLLNEMKREK